MRELGLALMVGAAVCVLIAVSGYIASHSKGMVGGEPPSWIALSREERDAEREKTKAKLTSWWPRFRSVGLLGIGLLILGIVLAALG